MLCRTPEVIYNSVLLNQDGGYDHMVESKDTGHIFADLSLYVEIRT
jgi:hypothetical protein